MNQEKAKQVLRKIKAFSKEQTQFGINEIRVIVALERAIARLTQNKDLDEHLIFKGGFVLLKSYQSERFTRDADALAVNISKQEMEHAEPPNFLPQRALSTQRKKRVFALRCPRSLR